MSNSTETVAAVTPDNPASPALISAVRDYIKANRHSFRLLRLSKRLTFQGIAEKIGVNLNAVRAWEQGLFLPEGDKAIRYLEILCPEVLVALAIEVQY